MRKLVFVLSASLAVMALTGYGAWAGTTTIDFSQGLGNLEQLGGSGSLSIDSNCSAVFSGTPTYLVPGAGSGAKSITMYVSPASDVPSGSAGIGLILFADSGEYVTALVNNLGLITLRNSLDSRAPTAQMGAPAASNAEFTLSYDSATDHASVTIAGFQANAQLSSAFGGLADTVQVGVFALGAGKFRGLMATGSNIPDLNSTGVCSGSPGEGEVIVEGEIVAEGESVAEGEATVEGEPVAPSVGIIGQPRVETGQRVTLIVSAVGMVGTVEYVWYKNTEVITTNTPSYTIASATFADAGEYVVTAEDESKALYTSEPFVLTVLEEGSLPLGGAAILGSMVILLGIGLSASMKGKSK